MLYVFKFPDIGEGIIEGKILEWYVKKGQTVSEGDSVVKVETDKVVTDIPIPRDGVIKNLYGKEGEVINVEDALVEMEVEGEVAEEDRPEAVEKETDGKEASAEEVAHADTEKKPVEEKGFGVVGMIEDATGDAFLPSTGRALRIRKRLKMPASLARKHWLPRWHARWPKTSG